MVKFSDPSFQNADQCSLYNNDSILSPKPRRTKTRNSYPTTSRHGCSSKPSSSIKTRVVGSDVSFPSPHKAKSNKAAVSDDAYKSSLLKHSKECMMENDLFIKEYEAMRGWFDDDDENKMPNCNSNHRRRSTNGFREFDDGTTKLTVKQHSYDNRLRRTSSNNNIFGYDAVNGVPKPIHRRELMTSNDNASTKLTVVNSKLSDLNEMKEFAASMRRRIKSHTSSLLLTNKEDGTAGTTGESEMGGVGGGVPAGDAASGCDDNRKSSEKNNTANGMNNNIRSRLATVTQRSNEGLRQQELVGMGSIKNKVASRVRSVAKDNDSEIIDSLIVTAGSESGIRSEEDDDENNSKRKVFNKKTQAQPKQHYSEEASSKTYDPVLERDASYKTNKSDLDEWWAPRTKESGIRREEDDDENNSKRKVLNEKTHAQPKQHYSEEESSKTYDPVPERDAAYKTNKTDLDEWWAPRTKESGIRRKEDDDENNSKRKVLNEKTHAQPQQHYSEEESSKTYDPVLERDAAYKTNKTDLDEWWAIRLSRQQLRTKESSEGRDTLFDDLWGESGLEEGLTYLHHEKGAVGARRSDDAMEASLSSKQVKQAKLLMPIRENQSILANEIPAKCNVSYKTSRTQHKESVAKTSTIPLSVESICSKHLQGCKTLYDKISSSERSIGGGRSSISSPSNGHMQQAMVTIPHCPDTPRSKPMDSFHTPFHNTMRAFAFAASYDRDELPSLAAASTLSEDDTQLSTPDQSLIVLFVRIEEAKASLTRALLDGNAEEQNRLGVLLTYLEDVVAAAMRNA